jgi:ATP-dependent Clp protease protease subunit
MTKQQSRPKERTMILGEEVDQSSVKNIIKTIYDINLEDEEQESIYLDHERHPIHLIVNTFGGSVYDGLGLIGAIELSTTPVVVTCLGSAMSMGLFILASGHHRRAHHLSTMMYHQISLGAYDKIEGLRKDMEEAQRLEELCENILFKRTKLRKKDLEDYKTRKADWYISAEEALKFGIIDEIIGAPLISTENLEEAEKQKPAKKAARKKAAPKKNDTATKKPTKNS